MTKWSKIEDPEYFKKSPCCEAQSKGRLVGKRYIDAFCSNCQNRYARYDVYKDRYKIFIPYNTVARIVN